MRVAPAKCAIDAQLIEGGVGPLKLAAAVAAVITFPELNLRMLQAYGRYICSERSNGMRKVSDAALLVYLVNYIGEGAALNVAL